MLRRDSHCGVKIILRRYVEELRVEIFNFLSFYKILEAGIFIQELRALYFIVF